MSSYLHNNLPGIAVNESQIVISGSIAFTRMPNREMRSVHSEEEVEVTMYNCKTVLTSRDFPFEHKDEVDAEQYISNLDPNKLEEVLDVAESSWQSHYDEDAREDSRYAEIFGYVGTEFISWALSACMYLKKRLRGPPWSSLEKIMCYIMLNELQHYNEVMSNLEEEEEEEEEEERTDDEV